MGAGAFKNHRTGFQLIDQQPVRLDVTLTTTGKPTYQNVVPLVRRQGLLVYYLGHDLLEFGSILAPLEGQRQILLGLFGIARRQHS